MYYYCYYHYLYLLLSLSLSDGCPPWEPGYAWLFFQGSLSLSKSRNVFSMVGLWVLCYMSRPNFPTCTVHCKRRVKFRCVFMCFLDYLCCQGCDCGSLRSWSQQVSCPPQLSSGQKTRKESEERCFWLSQKYGKSWRKPANQQLVYCLLNGSPLAGASLPGLHLDAYT